MMNHDSIMMGFDGDHSGGAGCTNEGCSQEDWPQARGQTQWYEAVARTVGGPILDDVATRHQTGEFPWTVLPPYGEGGGSVAGEAPVISVIELYVTPFDRWGGGWDSAGDHLVSDLAAGQIIGFTILVADHDDAFEWMLWKPEGMQPPDDKPAYVDLWNARGNGLVDGLLLSSDPAGRIEGSAVDAVSWGRIKASLEFE